MPRLYLRPTQKQAVKGEWLLELDEAGGRLTDATGMPRAAFARAEAQGRFVLPSFWESVTQLGIRADDQGVVWFVPDGYSVGQIKTYLHVALAAQGSGAVQALRTKGCLLIIGGIGLALVALVLMIASMAQAFSNPAGGTYYVTVGAIVFGLILMGRGFAALSKAGQATEEAAHLPDQERPRQFAHRVHCPNCSHELRISDEWIGRETQCLSCGTRFQAHLPHVDEGSEPLDVLPAETGVRVSESFQDQGTYRPAPQSHEQASVEVTDFLVPTNVSMWSMLSCYLGLIGFCLPIFGFFFAVPAVIFGLIAVRQWRKANSYGGVTSNVRAIIGLTLGGLGVLVWGSMGGMLLLGSLFGK